MAEEPQELKLPTPTTKDVLPKKPRKLRPRKSMREDVYEPRIWVWALTICVILQLVGFVTCKPPSRGYYYRQRLSSSLSKSIEIAQARLSTLTNTAVQIASKYIQDDLLPWISHQWRVFRDGGSKFKGMSSPLYQPSIMAAHLRLPCFQTHQSLHLGKPEGISRISRPQLSA